MDFILFFNFFIKMLIVHAINVIVMCIINLTRKLYVIYWINYILVLYLLIKKKFSPSTFLLTNFNRSTMFYSNNI